MGDAKPWLAVWRAMQELGAALDDAGDLPDWALALSAALHDADEAATSAAMEEDASDD